MLAAFALAGWPGAANRCLEAGSFACFCEAPRAGLVRQPANTFSNFGFVAVGLGVAAAHGRLRARQARAPANPLTTERLLSTLCAVAIALLGPGSMFLHASLTGWGGAVDVLSMYLWATFAIAYAALRALRLRVRGCVALYAALFAAAAWSKLATSGSSDVVFGLLIGGFLLGEALVWRRRRELRQQRGWLALALLCFGLAFALWLPSRGPDGALCDPHSWLQGHAAWHLLSAAATGAIWLYWRSERAAAASPYPRPAMIAGIGYQGRTIDELVERLRARSVAVVIDVRELPWSRRAGFSKQALAERLAREGIRYVHVRAAGNPRANRKSGASSEEILARYREHLDRTPGVLEEILAAAGGERAALLCYEANVAECHRSVLLERLAALHAELEIDDL